MSNSPADNDIAMSSDRFDLVKRIPFYFGDEDRRLFGWLHIVDTSPNYDIGMVICPSLGVEYMSAYRPLRYVADYYALSGVPVIRFDYHGTGDSSGQNEDDNRLDDWLWSIEKAQNELKRLTGCSKTGFFGFRVGATLAAMLLESVRSEFLIMWAAVESGRQYIREIKALQRASSINHVDSSEQEYIEAGGAVFFPKTSADLEKIRLAELIPKAPHILLVPRDDLPVNRKLVDAWSQRKLNVTQIELLGYRDMVVDPHYVMIPHAAIRQLVIWTFERILRHLTKNNIAKLSESFTTRITLTAETGRSAGHAENTQNINESVICYGPNNKRIAILTEPEISDGKNYPIIIIANSGANHHVGPNRLYVLLARQLSRKGFRCLRVNVRGLGDSVDDIPAEENIVYIDNSSDEIKLAMQSFGADWLNNRFIILGLCSGSYYSFHAAKDIQDANIIESVMINPLTFYWTEGMSLDASPAINYSQWNWYKSAVKNPDSWLKLVKGRIELSELFKTIARRLKIIFQLNMKKLSYTINTDDDTVSRQDLNRDLMDITNNKRYLSFFLARNDPGYDILLTNAKGTVKKLLKKEKISIDFIENADHTFSKQKPRCELIDLIVNKLSKKYIENI